MIERATQERAAEMAPFIREADRAEIRKFLGMEASELLAGNIQDSEGEAWIISDDDGNPAAAWGLIEVEEGVAEAWLFSTCFTPAVQFGLARGCKKTVSQAKNRWPHIRLYSDPDKPNARRWNELCGFEYVGMCVFDGKPVMEFRA